MTRRQVPLDLADSAISRLDISPIAEPLVDEPVREVDCTAAWSPEQVDRLIDQVVLPARTEGTITDPARLPEEPARVRERGYSLDLGASRGSRRRRSPRPTRSRARSAPQSRAEPRSGGPVRRPARSSAQ
ncbi:hypothetical protein L332_08475 [Agrococcus pavilionensis RW1]|uniref:IclR-ED domain-containing protein n=1 Tax=Agrococcus pavilionensis RW1 TaxID=1330458 RepID=U1LPX8_9MICO|nr:IclR family transcriptional regulator C-terminal domain-containing protein [Agrococcus pavilionensis]ERG64484.1 hypothetical protein L332_08475 [Agrococcus pavilionensis RW1]